MKPLFMHRHRCPIESLRPMTSTAVLACAALLLLVSCNDSPSPDASRTPDEESQHILNKPSDHWLSLASSNNDLSIILGSRALRLAPHAATDRALAHLKTAFRSRLERFRSEPDELGAQAIEELCFTLLEIFPGEADWLLSLAGNEDTWQLRAVLAGLAGAPPAANRVTLRLESVLARTSSESTLIALLNALSHSTTVTSAGARRIASYLTHSSTAVFDAAKSALLHIKAEPIVITDSYLAAVETAKGTVRSLAVVPLAVPLHLDSEEVIRTLVANATQAEGALPYHYLDTAARLGSLGRQSVQPLLESRNPLVSASAASALLCTKDPPKRAVEVVLSALSQPNARGIALEVIDCIESLDSTQCDMLTSSLDSQDLRIRVKIALLMVRTLADHASRIRAAGKVDALSLSYDKALSTCLLSMAQVSEAIGLCVTQASRMDGQARVSTLRAILSLRTHQSLLDASARAAVSGSADDAIELFNSIPLDSAYGDLAKSYLLDAVLSKNEDIRRSALLAMFRLNMCSDDVKKALIDALPMCDAETACIVVAILENCSKSKG